MGYWGPNLYRNFAANPNFEVVAVSDPLADCRDNARRFNRKIPLYDDAIELIDSGTCDAVAIAMRSIETLGRFSDDAEIDVVANIDRILEKADLPL